MKILEANPQSVADFKAGKDRALGFLVGQAMKETKGKANPKMLNEMFLAELNKQKEEELKVPLFCVLYNLFLNSINNNDTNNELNSKN